MNEKNNNLLAIMLDLTGKIELIFFIIEQKNSKIVFLANEPNFSYIYIYMHFSFFFFRGARTIYGVTVVEECE